MAKDFFGYDRTVNADGAVLTSEFATIKFGGGERVELVQNVTASYRQNIQPKFEAGSPSLYWITGQPQGTVQMGRLLSKEGWFAGFDEFKNSCGTVKTCTIGLNGQSGCEAINSGVNKNSITFTDAVPEEIGVNFTAANLEVAENITLKVATLVVE